jgi:serine/threonine protein kinase
MAYDPHAPDRDTVPYLGNPHVTRPAPSDADAGDDRSTPPVPSYVLPKTTAESRPHEESEPLLTGRSLGPYVIKSLLGSGGMGSVYLAVRVDDYFQQVAIKFVRHDHGSDEILRRFRTERQVLAGLSHPSIVRLLDGGTTDDGLPYFVMEYVEGKAIDACRIAGHPPTLAQRVRLFHPVCEAIHYAHAQGILHRDLKPSNVLITEDNIPKVTDFGLAKQMESLTGATHGQTRTGAIVGTPSYMSPEQASGRTRDIGPAADVYSLGAILYELLTGRPPFRAESPVDTLMQVMTEEPVPPRRLDPSLPRDLETICLKCLEKSPSRRYANAQDLADDVERFLAGKPISARPMPPIERLARWGRRNRLVAGLLAALLLALSSGLVATTYLWQTAQRAKDKADEQSRLVENTLTSASEFTDQMTQTLRGSELPARRRLLEQAKEQFERLRANHGDTPPLLFRLAYSLMQLEDVCRRMGDKDAAMLAGREAVDLMDRLHHDDPESKQYAAKLAHACANLAANHFDGCEAYEDRALTIWERLRQEYPDDGFELGMAYIYVNRAMTRSDQGKLPEARDLLEQARAWRSAYELRNPDQRENSLQLGKILVALGYIHRGRNTQEARRWFQEACDHLERATRRHAEDATFPSDLANGYELLAFEYPDRESIPFLEKSRVAMEEAIKRTERANAGVRAALIQFGQHIYHLGLACMKSDPAFKSLSASPGRDALTSARDIFEKLATGTPPQDFLRYMLAVCHHDLAEGKPLTEQIQADEKAIPIMERFAAQNTDNHLAVSEFGIMLQNYAENLAKEGRYAEAVGSLTRAFEQQQKAILRAPNEEGYLKSLADHYCALAEVQARPADPMEAAAWVAQKQERRKLLTVAPPQMQTVARHLSERIDRVGQEEDDYLIPAPMLEKRRQLLAKLADEVSQLAKE